MIDEQKTFDSYGYVSNELKTHSQKPIVAVCDQCGRIRIMRRGTYKKCCRNCVRKLTPNLIKCIQCGKSIRVYPSQTETKKFCSVKCRAEWQHIHIKGVNHPLYGKQGLSGVDNPNYKPRRQIICIQCGKKFEVMAGNQTAKFCSTTCYGVWKTGHYMGINNPNYANGDKIKGKNNPFYNKHHSKKSKILSSCTKRKIDINEWNGFAPPPSRDHIVKPQYCIRLNKPFTGCEGHHLSRSLLIYIPKELHNHIRHNLKTGKGMSSINGVAIQYLYNV